MLTKLPSKAEIEALFPAERPADRQRVLTEVKDTCAISVSSISQVVSEAANLADSLARLDFEGLDPLVDLKRSIVNRNKSLVIKEKILEHLSSKLNLTEEEKEILVSRDSGEEKFAVVLSKIAEIQNNLDVLNQKEDNTLAVSVKENLVVYQELALERIFIYCKVRLGRDKLYENELTNIRKYASFLGKKENFLNQILVVYANNRKDVLIEKVKQIVDLETDARVQITKEFNSIGSIILDEFYLLHFLLPLEGNAILSKQELKTITAYYSLTSSKLELKPSIDKNSENSMLLAFDQILAPLEEILQAELKSKFKEASEIRDLYKIALETAGLFTLLLDLNSSLSKQEFKLTKLIMHFSRQFSEAFSTKIASTASALQKYSDSYAEILEDQFDSPLGCSFYSDFEYAISEINTLCQLYSSVPVKVTEFEPKSLSLTTNVLRFFYSWASFELDSEIVLVKLINMVTLFEHDMALDSNVSIADIRREIMSFLVSRIAQKTIKGSEFEKKTQEVNSLEEMIDVTDELLNTGLVLISQQYSQANRRN